MKRDGEARGLGPRITQSKRKLNTSRGVEKCANGSSPWLRTSSVIF